MKNGDMCGSSKHRRGRESTRSKGAISRGVGNEGRRGGDNANDCVVGMDFCVQLSKIAEVSNHYQTSSLIGLES